MVTSGPLFGVIYQKWALAAAVFWAELPSPPLAEPGTLLPT